MTWTIEAIVDPSARPGRPPTSRRRRLRARAGRRRRALPAVPDSVREALREPRRPEAREDPDASADRDDPVVEAEEIDPEAAAEP